MLAALINGGLPSVASADVGVSGSAAASGGTHSPRAPTIAAGVAESSETFCGGAKGLSVVLNQTVLKVGWDGTRIAKDLGGGSGASSEPSGGRGVSARKCAGSRLGRQAELRLQSASRVQARAQGRRCSVL